AAARAVSGPSPGTCGEPRLGSRCLARVLNREPPVAAARVDLREVFSSSDKEARIGAALLVVRHEIREQPTVRLADKDLKNRIGLPRAEDPVQTPVLANRELLGLAAAAALPDLRHDPGLVGIRGRGLL